MLIFDEVITGFRVCYGGAQTLFGITPDLTTLGKIIGGGLPVAAYGGRRDLMDRVAPLGPVYQAGTLSGNPLAMSAGIASLDLLAAPGFYESLDARAKRLGDGIAAALRETGAPATAVRAGSLLTLFFSREPVTDYAAAKKCDTRRFAEFFRGMLDRGVFLAPSQFEALFVSAAHTDADIDRTLAAVRESLAAAVVDECDSCSAGVSPAIFAPVDANSPARRRRHKYRNQHSTVSIQKEQEFMPDELSELQENAEHGRENPSLAPISVTMAILAVCVAVVSLLGHRSHTEELLMQNRATDQWAYYQAKNIRLHNYDMSLDLLPLIEFKDKEQAGKVQEKYQSASRALYQGAGRNRGAGQGFRRRIGARATQGGPLRSGRSVSRNCAGDFFARAALAQADFLVFGNYFRRCGTGGRRNRTV